MEIALTFERSGIRGLGWLAGLAIGLRVACATAICCLLAAPVAAEVPAAATTTKVRAANVTADGERSVVAFDLSAGVPAEIFTLADPYRVVIELPGVSFDLPPGTGDAGESKLSPLVKGFRYGAFAEGRSRVVLDTETPVEVSGASIVKAGHGVRLQFTLTATDPATFGAGTGAERVGRPSAQPPRQAVEPTPNGGDGRRIKPLVMIDPGHGGVDPGAIGVARKTTEKSVVLAVAWQLKSALEATGRYETKMTRSADVFIALDKRVQMSEEARPDLFVSLHADAIDDASAQSATGASIYTLSDKASDEQARKMAEKENAADLVAGVGRRNAEAPDEVRGILSDLWARENSAFAHLLSRSLAGSLARMKALGRTPERSAAFRVLRQSHAPAVLIELGFLSNVTEEAKLASTAWQKQVAGSIANAIDTYFERRKTHATASPGLPSAGGLPP
ncbi:MAG: N-acetylmuramoyl-L-alanine amidase [Hyphomicrobiaceae bacterium]|nr:N-acetylmuramoyl-L-alanine amidase [Hyphomicrobiaceae bacterium]